MENGRQLKIQRWIEEREREGDDAKEESRERERENGMGVGANVTCAKKRKKTERDRLLAEFCSDPRIRSVLTSPLPAAKNNGRRMCLLFHFWICDHSCSLVFAFPSFLSPFLSPNLLSYPCLSVFRRTWTERKRASQGA